MTVNKYKILLPTIRDKSVNIPIEINWDLLDRSDSIVEFEKSAIKEILNQEKDFEVARFAHAEDDATKTTDINYDFYFAPSGATSANTTWDTSYIVQGFNSQEVYFYRKSFENSFFKLDFYDTPNQINQTNYITTILPVQQGFTTSTQVGFSVQNIKIPKFKLDYLGDKEGFFLYWLKKRTFLNINTFYMTAKFFDAKSGIFVKMMNKAQATLVGINKFNFPPDIYFYYKVILNYDDFTYRVYDVVTGNEVGNASNPINWFEYLNP